VISGLLRRRLTSRFWALLDHVTIKKRQHLLRLIFRGLLTRVRTKTPHVPQFNSPAPITAQLALGPHAAIPWALIRVFAMKRAKMFGMSPVACVAAGLVFDDRQEAHVRLFGWFPYFRFEVECVKSAVCL
jgi:hypothetical protein